MDSAGGSGADDLRFPYDRFEADPSYADPAPFVFRPVVPIRVIGLVGSKKFNAILDTDATETILPSYLIGQTRPAIIQGEQGVLLGAVGRPFVVAYGTVDLELRMQRRVYRWHAKVAFHPSRQDALLGDADFLRLFTATFNGPQRYVTLKPNGKFPPPIMPVS